MLARIGFDALRGRHVLAPQAWAAMAGLGVFAVVQPKSGLDALLTAVLFASLVVVSLYDVRYWIIPDPQIVLLGVTGAVAAVTVEADSWPVRVAAASLAAGALAVTAVAYRHRRGRDGLGWGDVKLFGVGALWLAPEHLATWLLAAIASALVTLGLTARHGGEGRMGDTALPFGPHLALGLWLVWLAT